MRRSMLLLAGALGVVAAEPANAAGACSKACLTGLMDRYIAQMIAHQPSGGVVAVNAIIREDGRAVTADGGWWAKITKVRGGQSFADPVSGQIFRYGVADTSDGLRPVSLRLKAVGGKVIEAEMLVPTPGGPMNPANYANLLQPDVLYEAPVPADRRSTRAQMQAIVISYITAIGKHDPKGVPFGPRCDRYAAGTKFTNNIDLVTAPETQEQLGKVTCGTSMINLKGQDTVDRRVPIVDVEKGIAIGFFLIPHKERTPPNSTYGSEVFKIVDGHIRSIEELSKGVPLLEATGFAAR